MKGSQINAGTLQCRIKIDPKNLISSREAAKFAKKFR